MQIHFSGRREVKAHKLSLVSFLMEFIIFHFELKCYEVSTTPRLNNEGRNLYSGYRLMFIASNWKYFLGDNQT